jgi:hypothetical protein
MTIHRLTIALLSFVACHAGGGDRRITAATALTQQYAQSHFEKWHIRASAAGNDCGVLLVETSIVLDEAMVDAMHAGTGPYAVKGRGLQHFSRDSAFRAVVYRDPTGRVWPYGDLGADDARSVSPCH